MTSYQNRKLDIKRLEKEVEELKNALYQKAKIFYADLKWLGAGNLTTGVLIGDKVTEIHRQNFNTNKIIKMDIVIEK